jgi:predicted RNA-binding Zn-ribbon protein involved in translation (DUF1610 family)
MSEYADVIKKHRCPACGNEEVMRFRHNGTMEATCPGCGAIVQWDMKERAADSYPQAAYGDDRPGFLPATCEEAGAL